MSFCFVVVVVVFKYLQSWSGLGLDTLESQYCPVSVGRCGLDHNTSVLQIKRINQGKENSR